MLLPIFRFGIVPVRGKFPSVERIINVFCGDTLRLLLPTRCIGLTVGGTVCDSIGTVAESGSRSLPVFRLPTATLLPLLLIDATGAVSCCRPLGGIAGIVEPSPFFLKGAAAVEIIATSSSSLLNPRPVDSCRRRETDEEEAQPGPTALPMVAAVAPLLLL